MTLDEMKRLAAEAISYAEIKDYHACTTGDCDHDKQVQCTEKLTTDLYASIGESHKLATALTRALEALEKCKEQRDIHVSNQQVVLYDKELEEMLKCK